MSNLIPEFAHMQIFFTIPAGLDSNERRLLLLHVHLINEKFFGDVELYGDGYHNIPDGDNPSAAKKIVEALQRLCEVAGIPVYIGRITGCWLLGIVWE